MWELWRGSFRGANGWSLTVIVTSFSLSIVGKLSTFLRLMSCCSRFCLRSWMPSSSRRRRISVESRPTFLYRCLWADICEINQFDSLTMLWWRRSRRRKNVLWRQPQATAQSHSAYLTRPNGFPEVESKLVCLQSTKTHLISAIRCFGIFINDKIDPNESNTSKFNVSQPCWMHGQWQSHRWAHYFDWTPFLEIYFDINHNWNHFFLCFPFETSGRHRLLPTIATYVWINYYLL